MTPPQTYTLLRASADDVYKLFIHFGGSVVPIVIAGTIDDLPFALHPRSPRPPTGLIHVVEVGKAYWLLVERDDGSRPQFVAVPSEGANA